MSRVGQKKEKKMAEKMQQKILRDKGQGVIRHRIYLFILFFDEYLDTLKHNYLDSQGQ